MGNVRIIPARDREYDGSHFFSVLIEASPDIIYIYDRIEQRYVFVSGRCAQVLGYKPEDMKRLRGNDIERLVHPDDLEGVRTHYARQAGLSDHDVAETAYRVAHSSGEYRTLRCRQKVFSRDRSGTVKCILGIATDITDQLRRREEIDGLREQMLAIRDEERKRIALRLHDTVVGHLVGAALLLDSVKVQQAGTATTSLVEVRRSLSRALRQLVEPLAEEAIDRAKAGLAERAEGQATAFPPSRAG